MSLSSSERHNTEESRAKVDAIIASTEKGVMSDRSKTKRPATMNSLGELEASFFRSRSSGSLTRVSNS
ncbi:hypothetical protein J1N35_023407 [Gossypium stocksii]|uniref:Uncharacterized protein n=1 Tax=Gossypium stocksii TaxID=47602 RepID=A0A9D4A223_9ROSI|nr:hypothetical protein J1N35_023407 [Gossypium stocksii]